ncbi:glycosyltransferase family 4 protein [Gabonibacter chumensis]|uniref:glycosyltransferase family 4 protein n=1 Tax=Gabonibacter chumensis TaxID=2972474 RepID=UPI002572B430|nr:glycosyltransferase family 4 protein [Gabonibacter chumensis]MCR9010687.1 glycosyltransferase family 4 protein [Gabonibacter chumensis]
MKVLFVSSGNSDRGISPIIRNQGDSLEKEGCRIEYYTIEGKGFWGYLKNVLPLRRFLKQYDFDIVHAHYSLSVFVASLAGAKPLIASLMGSDVQAGCYYKYVIRVFTFLFSWKVIIVKSEDMKKMSGIRKVLVIPNGVSLERFKPLDKTESRKRLGWDLNRKHLLFAADPGRYEKNYSLVESAINVINDANIQIHFLKNIPNAETLFWYNAADVVLLASLWEGSPNAIKEAMACNCPIVATRVGDIEWLLNNEEGCFLTNFNVDDCVEQIQNALCFCQENDKTNGRKRISDLGLESKSIAKRIIEIYNNIL